MKKETAIEKSTTASVIVNIQQNKSKIHFCFDLFVFRLHKQWHSDICLGGDEFKLFWNENVKFVSAPIS